MGMLAADRIDEAFLRTQAGWYLSSEVELAQGLVFSDLIEDFYWNFATGRSLEVLGFDGSFRRLYELGRMPAVALRDDEIDRWSPEVERHGLRLQATETIMTSSVTVSVESSARGPIGG